MIISITNLKKLAKGEIIITFNDKIDKALIELNALSY